LAGLFIDHGSPDPWGHSSQLGPGSYSSSAGSYSNSYGMHPRDSMVSRVEQFSVTSLLWCFVAGKFGFYFYVYDEGFCLFVCF